MFRLALTTLALVAVSISAQADPTKVPAFYDTVYAPAGFDSNDQIQIVGEGMFRNTCYRAAETAVKVDNEKKQIFIGPAAYEYSGFCLQMILPFDRVIELGILPEGQYDVMQMADGSKLGALKVAKATSNSADDFLYAPVSQAFFRQKAAVSEIYVTGDFPNSCMSMDDVKITIEPKVIVVQPIAKMDLQRTDCKDGKFHFEKLVQAEMIPAGRYLMHVRSMNSKAINTLVDVK